jgi:transposase
MADDVIEAAGWNGGQPARKLPTAAVANGMNCAEAAEHYQVSHTSVIRWKKRQAETGSPAALPMGGKKRFALAGEEAWIRERVAAAV